MLAARPSPVARTLGWLLMTLWLAAAAAIVYQVINDSEAYQKYFSLLVRGALVTIKLIVLSVSIGALLSLPIAFARMSASPMARALSFGYVYFFRGTPLIAQIFLVYYGVAEFRHSLESVKLWWLFRDPFYCGILVFSLNTAAYQAEILRGAILNVPKAQLEAGMAMSLPALVIFRKITLPQALIIALRPYGNEIILLIKGSAVVSIITVFDIMGETRRLFSRTFDYNTYILAALFYLAIVEALRHIWERLEHHLTRHLHR